LKVQQCENSIPSRNDVYDRKMNPNFKSGLGDVAFNVAGNIMQGVQNSGFIASFLIQDGLGMTAPRVGTAFLRDKEVTGEYNFQEGREVLLREGLTGPIMMAVAPVMFLLTSKFGKSTTVNSQLIKRFGNNFREMISKPEFKKELLNDKQALRRDYLENNLRKMLDNTLGSKNYGDNDIKFIMECIEKLENPPEKLDVKGLFKKKNYKRGKIREIELHINNLLYKSSSDLTMLDRLKVGEEDMSKIASDITKNRAVNENSKDAIRTYSTKDAIEALLKYSDDIITNNKYLSDITPETAEYFRDKSISKRIIATIATIAATLGVMSVIPKIYAKSDISPGARTAMQLKAAEEKKSEEENLTAGSGDSITFKGKGGKGGGNWLSKLGKFIRKHQNENFSSELEYDGHNFTNTLFAALSVGGLIIPRGLRAVNRAQIDENGKKDYTELYEILIRDLASSLSVIFAVPMLTRAFVTSYEHKSGFVLMDKNRNQTKIQKFLDLINPYSKTHVLTNKELESLYFGVDSNEKMLNFCKYIDENNGDLQKIFAKSETSGEVFNEKTLKLSDIEKLTKKEKNTKIIDFFEKMGKESGESKAKFNEAIKKMMQGSELKAKGNKLLSFVKGLNSMPAFITTFAISPIILGWFIPRMTYANTRRIHAKKEREAKNKVNTAA